MKEVFLNVTGTEKIRETRKAKEGDPAIFTCAFRIQSKKKKKKQEGSPQSETHHPGSLRSAGAKAPGRAKDPGDVVPSSALSAKPQS